MKKYIRKISDVAAVGGVSALVLVVISGCDTPPNNQFQQPQSTSKAIKQGALVILEEQPNDRYKILEEYPSSQTRIVLRDKQGNERILSDEEVQQLLKDEEKRIDNGTSELVAENGGGGGGLSLGGAVLASAAGAILGSYIGNKLFNNPNFQQNKQRNYKSPQAYERSANTFNRGAQGTARTGAPGSSKQGFFGNNAGANSASSNRTNSGFGG